jgi:hypothetical protein
VEQKNERGTPHFANTLTRPIPTGSRNLFAIDCKSARDISISGRTGDDHHHLADSTQRKDEISQLVVAGTRPTSKLDMNFVKHIRN